jgi:hypothetical protein
VQPEFRRPRLLARGGAASSSGTLAFISTRETPRSISVHADGSAFENLSSNLAEDGQPSWSLDG